MITDVLAEHNAMGYSGTNAGGDLSIVNSEWRLNISGIVPNTLDSELLPPQRDAYIAGNYVHDNNSTTADTKDLEYPTFGSGIILAGGRDNLVEGNLVEDQRELRDRGDAEPGREPVADRRERGAGNVVRASGRADLALGRALRPAATASRGTTTRRAPRQRSSC